MPISNPVPAIVRFLKSHILMTAIIYGVAIGLLGGAVWLAYQFVDPLPPSKVTIAAGSKTGAYTKFARKYAEVFAREGVELIVVESNGSMDNLAKMADPENGVDAAFMQGGITTPEAHPDLRSLGSLYYEPLWVLYNKKNKIDKLADFKGKTAVIGPKGSGTNYLIKQLFSENDVTLDNTTLLERSYTDAVPELVKGDIDMMGIITGVKSPVIESLSKPDSNVRLFSFARAETYARSYHYLNRLVLPRGGVNLAEDLPRKDINLLAPTANLVVKDDMHAAIKFLFLLAAREIHNKGDIFAMPGEFPNDKSLLFPLSDEATSFYKNGPPFLMRFLPYRLAVMLERLKILLIPLLTLLYPLFKVTPPAYRWQIRRRIFKWYKHLKALDMEAYEITSRTEADAMLEKLEVLDRQVLDTSVPLSYTDYIYSLRIHIRMIQDRLEKVCCEDK
ncbi:ABC transporter substrate-binding protein [Pseudodesulfovibrio sp.]|nr:ABC transporter substrate-binding protein [Pseudodesulfovibrio sp.]